MLAPDLKNAKILIVDDQEANINLLNEFLFSQGFTDIVTTTDPLMVLGLFDSFNPDIILLDLMMPLLSGYEILEQLNQVIGKNVFCPVLVLTADISASAKQRSLARGAKDFIAKPFNLVELLFRIINLLETRCMYQQLEEKNRINEEKVEILLEMLGRKKI